jgi:LacI family transcriptional regulator
MPQKRKIAMTGAAWLRMDTRLLAGGLHYANAHPEKHLEIRAFSHFSTTTAAAAAAAVEEWGAEGVFGGFTDERMQAFKGALKRQIPIVNNAASSRFSGVVQVIGDGHMFVDTAEAHLRRFGIESFGLLNTVVPPSTEDRILSRFTSLTSMNTSALYHPVSEEQMTGPEWNTIPVPTPVANWLRELPKPCGVLCPCYGLGRCLAHWCTLLGLKVPEDVAIICGDDMDMCLSSTPTLTSITPNMEMVGEESVRMLLEMIAGNWPADPRVRIRSAELMVRESTGRQRPATSNIAKALEFIKANATKGLSVTQLMRETQFTSQPTFYDGFFKATGKTPAQAIRERQLEEVRRLLATTHLTVTEVSGMAGFSSSTVMTRLFNKKEGMTPLEYRKRHGSG